MNPLWTVLIVVLVLVGLMIFNDKVFTPWQTKKSFEKFLKRHREGKIRPPHFDVSIVLDSTGFFIQDGKTQDKSKRLTWNEIVKVTAFKRDFISTDCICLFLAKGDETGQEVREEMNGWGKFIDELPSYLPGCRSSTEWLSQVATPAFKPNVMEIFLRGGAS